MPEPGIVYLIGAGPGDPELITVAGLKRLRQADVVVFDRLAHPALLDEAPPQAKRINVGKAPGRQPYSQDEINALLIREAGRGKQVARLKGGDPFVFGRGGEECQALAQAGIAFEVIPGVTSAVAVPAYAGIPVTHRGIARSFTVITGHTAAAEPANLDWAALARLDTLVFLMGVSNLSVITAQLMAHGRAAETPVAVVRCGATELQEVIQGSLATISDLAQGMRPPATIIIGPVVNLRQEIAWFKPAVAERAVFPRQKEEGRRQKEEVKTAVAERAVFLRKKAEGRRKSLRRPWRKGLFSRLPSRLYAWAGWRVTPGRLTPQLRWR
jgi:uroporphyrin-III C-methyltransferase